MASEAEGRRLEGRMFIKMIPEEERRSRGAEVKCVVDDCNGLPAWAFYWREGCKTLEADACLDHIREARKAVSRREREA